MPSFPTIAPVGPIAESYNRLQFGLTYRIWTGTAPSASTNSITPPVTPKPKDLLAIVSFPGSGGIGKSTSASAGFVKDAELDVATANSIRVFSRVCDGSETGGVAKQFATWSPNGSHIYVGFLVRGPFAAQAGVLDLDMDNALNKEEEHAAASTVNKTFGQATDTTDEWVLYANVAGNNRSIVIPTGWRGVAHTGGPGAGYAFAMGRKLAALWTPQVVVASWGTARIYTHAVASYRHE